MAKVDTDGKQSVISKDVQKSMLGRSPDDLDCYIMRAYFDLKSTEVGETVTANNYIPVVKTAEGQRVMKF